MAEYDLEFVYGHLKDKYALLLTNTFSLANGQTDYQDDFPILCSNSIIGQFHLYHNGLYYIFDIDKADGSYTHLHPENTPKAIALIEAFMNGTLDC